VTLLAPSAAQGVGTVIPVAASLAIRPLLEGAPTAADMLGTSGSLIWLGVGADCVVLSGDRTIRLPNGIQTPNPRRHRSPATREAIVGRGAVVIDGLEFQIARWWDPTPRIGAVDLPALLAGLASVPPPVGDPPAGDLEDALGSRDPAKIVDAAKPLLGRGDGLTPFGDDVLAGAVSAFRLFGDGLGDRSAGSSLDRCTARLLALARGSTTLLSASLLRHALAGRVAAPVGPFLAALAGRGDVAATRAAVERIGHSSGTGLTVGILAGARAVSGGTS
jgi:hypothetical protein